MKKKMVRTYGLWIKGKEVKSSSGKTFPTINPTTEQPLASFHQGTGRDIDLAVKAAADAQKKWASIPAPHRGEILFEIARMLKKRKQELGKLVSTEMGKVLREGAGDVQEAIDIAVILNSLRAAAYRG